MIMTPYTEAGPSLQLKGQADFWHPTGHGGHLVASAGDQVPRRGVAVAAVGAAAFAGVDKGRAPRYGRYRIRQGWPSAAVPGAGGKRPWPQSSCGARKCGFGVPCGLLGS